MNLMKYFSVLILLAFMVVSGCKDDNSAAKNDARNSLNVPETVTPVTPAVTNTGGAVAHYICPNNCEGSGGPSAGACPVCGTAYVHNQAFHSQPAATTTTNTTAPTNSAQNAAGQYHYICSSGCAGGSGAQGNCATCGNALVHNQAYHN